MSAGPRMPLARAEAAARLLMERWAIHRSDCLVAGSVRRGEPLVGDLDLVCPLPAPGGPDLLFNRIDATLERTGELFSDPAAGFARPVSGCKAHFLACSLVVRLAGVEPGAAATEVPVQIHRHDPGNKGWLWIMKTGPVEFCRWFLWCWKQHHRIPHVEGRHALIDNHLVDEWGKVVPVRTEEDAFDACGLGWVAPERRAAHVVRERDRLARLRRERLR